MKKIFVVIVILLFVGIGVFTGIKAYKKISEGKKPNKKSRVNAVVAVETVMPSVMDIKDLRRFTGNLKPWSNYDLAPKVGGRLENLTVNIGDKVTKGMLIAKIDDVEYRQQVDQAKADLDIALAQLNEAQINLVLKSKEFNRQKELRAKNIVAQAQYETSESAFLTQEAGCKMKEAEVARKKTALQAAELKLRDTSIYADWESGDNVRYVGERFIDEGALLPPNQPILSIIEINRLKAAIFVIEQDYPHLKIGQEADIITDAYPGKIFKGKIVKISQLLQENSRQASILLEIPNDDLKLKPGMFVRAEIEFSRHSAAQVIPLSALLTRQGQNGVFRYSQELGKVFFVPVKTGIISGDLIEIVSPKLTSPLVTLGNHLLANGMEVLVPEAAAPPATSVTVNENVQNTTEKRTGKTKR